MPTHITPDAGDDGSTARLAHVVKAAREQRGWTQDELADAAGISRPTVQRFENGKTATPQPDVLRRVFTALGLDIRRIPVILGYVTAEEMAVPDEAPPVLTPAAEEALRILQDPAIPAVTKAEWIAFLKFRAQQRAEQA